LLKVDRARFYRSVRVRARRTAGSDAPASYQSGPLLGAAIRLQLQRGRLLFGLETLGTIAMLGAVFAAPFLLGASSEHTNRRLVLHLMCALASFVLFHLWLRHSKAREGRVLQEYQQQLRDIELTQLAMSVATTPEECDQLVRGLKRTLQIDKKPKPNKKAPPARGRAPRRTRVSTPKPIGEAQISQKAGEPGGGRSAVVVPFPSAASAKRGKS
jgi:hypothetical protein